MNKHYENTRPKGIPKKRWIEGILESLGNISIAEVTKKASDRKLYLPTTFKDKWGRIEEEEEDVKTALPNDDA
jgi:hypothetical protein